MVKVLLALVLVLTLASPSQAADCVAKFKATAPDNGIPSMSLFNFGEHWELQFDTPSQQFPETVALAIDGAPQKVFISGGLDDLLFVASSEEAALSLSDGLLASFATGRELTVSGNLGGKSFTTTFALKGSAVAVLRLKGGCG